MRKRYLDAAVVDRSGGLRTTGVRWWLKYVVLGRGALPFTRLTSNSPHEEKVEAEKVEVVTEEVVEEKEEEVDWATLQT